MRVKTCCTKAIFKKCAKRRLPPALCYVFGHDFTVGVKGHVTLPDCYFTSDAMALRLSSCASKRSVVFKAPRASSRQRTREVRRSKFTGGLGQRLDLNFFKRKQVATARNPAHCLTRLSFKGLSRRLLSPRALLAAIARRGGRCRKQCPDPALCLHWPRGFHVGPAWHLERLGTTPTCLFHGRLTRRLLH